MNITRNIVAVAKISAANLTGFVRVGNQVSYNDDLPWEELDVKVPAKLTVSDKIENGNRIYAASLVFLTCSSMEEKEKQVYRCKAANGTYYIIGSNERPFPITTTTENHPDNMSDNQLLEVNVNYTSAQQLPTL